MKISEHCYALTGLSAMPPWVVNAGFAVGQTKTVIVDTGMNVRSAQTIHGYATAIRPENELVVINSEPHFDHIGGNAFFDDLRVKIYGHPDLQRTDAEFKAEMDEYNEAILNPVRRGQQEAEAFFAETRLVNPTNSLAEGDLLDLGDLEAQILYTPGHTKLNISIYIAAAQVLFCGDCLVGDYIPNLEAGGQEDWQVWLESLEKIERLAPNVILPGHGNILRNEAIAQEIARHQYVLRQAIEMKVAPTSAELE